MGDATSGPERCAVPQPGAELEFLAERNDDALDGRGRIVLVGGPAGIGKSWLVDELADWIEIANSLFISGRTVETHVRNILAKINGATR